MSADAAGIAAGLTKAQRAALVEPHHWLHPGGQEPIAGVDHLVGLHGPIAEMFTLRWDRITPFGHDVRRAILASQGTGVGG